MKLILGTDHGGYENKEEIKRWLMQKGREIEDMGAMSLVEDDDFSDYAFLVARKIESEGGKGIVWCRNGVGVSIAANRIKGVRCALGFDERQVEKARNDDDVNCLALPADYMSVEEQKRLIEKFLETEFSGEERFGRRINKLDE